VSEVLGIGNGVVLDVVIIVPFVGYMGITTAEGDTYVYPASEVVHVICEYDSPDYDDYDQEYDRMEREWLDNEARHHEERMLFLQTSHISPAIMDGWYSG